jgi:4-amino-4-deoxy-L-arabinose transferase-like glycosyltransferase
MGSLAPSLWRTQAERIAVVLLVATTLAATGLRFWRLQDSPPGFFADEAVVSAHVLCLKEEGRNLFGDEWPLVSRVLGRGYSSLAWQMPAVAWSELTGDSIAAMRSFAAVSGTLLVAGVFVLTLWSTRSKWAAVFAAATLAISPWAFQFSRIAWDPAIAPVYLTWGLAFLIRSLDQSAQRYNLRWLWIVMSAALLALALISYAPMRAQIALVIAALTWWKRGQLSLRWLEATVFIALLLLLSSPIWLGTLSGQLVERFDYLSVFSESLWAQRGFEGAARLPLGLLLFARNIGLHFSPGYLLTSGDQNLRHSTQTFGEWSWLDAVAISTFVVVTLARRWRWSAWTWLVLAGYVAGLVPAALTWESPHALRSIGALPFLAIFVGMAIDRLRLENVPGRGLTTIAAACIAMAFVIVFARDYLWEYPERAAADFDRPVVERIATQGPSASIADIAPGYSKAALRYYEVRSGAPCLPITPRDAG